MNNTIFSYSRFGWIFWIYWSEIGRADEIGEIHSLQANSICRWNYKGSLVFILR